MKDFTGISSPFEAPKNPEIEVKTNELTVQESVKRIIEKLEIK
ncbi:MAG TPA: adenylyl-sulfate kinase [Bacteroidia bacterium]|nr:adenylyl-sulfate kinase [Bacteroidia bacterium]